MEAPTGTEAKLLEADKALGTGNVAVAKQVRALWGGVRVGRGRGYGDVSAPMYMLNLSCLLWCLSFERVPAVVRGGEERRGHQGQEVPRHRRFVYVVALIPVELPLSLSLVHQSTGRWPVAGG